MPLSGTTHKPGRPWLRAAGWLVLLPPLFFLRQLVLLLDQPRRFTSLRAFVEGPFGFWEGGRPFELRLQAGVGLLLFLVAIAVGLTAAFGGVGRIATVLVAGAQALVCPLGILWDHQGFRDLPPAAVRKLPVPVPGGRATCVLYLVLALAALVLALVDKNPARSGAIPLAAPPPPPLPGDGWTPPGPPSPAGQRTSAPS